MGHETLRGLLHLNIGYTQRRMRSGDYGIGEFEEAVRLTAEQPALHARSQIALIETRIDYAGQLGEDPATADLISRLSNAESVGDSRGDDELSALAAATIADVHLAVRPSSPQRLQAASDAMGRALGHLEAAGLDLWLIELSLLRSGLLQDLAQTPDGERSELLEEARAVLARAQRILDGRSAQAPGLVPRQHEDWLRTRVAAEMLWLAASSGHSADVEVALLSAAAQEPETTRLRLRTRGQDAAERAVLGAEGQLLQASSRATAGEHLAEYVDRLEEVNEDSTRAHVRLLLQSREFSTQEPAEVEQEAGRTPRLQLVLSSRGTIAALHVADEPVTYTRIGLTGQRLVDLLHGPKGWIETTAAGEDASRSEFAAATEALVRTVRARTLMQRLAQVPLQWADRSVPVRPWGAAVGMLRPS